MATYLGIEEGSLNDKSTCLLVACMFRNRSDESMEQQEGEEEELVVDMRSQHSSFEPSLWWDIPQHE
jgi:hypothetical protein